MRIKCYRSWCTLIFFISNLLFSFAKEQTEQALNDDVCRIDPEDAERARFMAMSSQDQETQINSSEDVSLLSHEEKETLLVMSKKDFNLVETCKDNRRMFNETIFSELNLFHIFESEGRTQLVRNYTSSAVLELDPEKVKCKYSFIKSDADSDVDDSKHDIPLKEEGINFEGPHNTVGVVCTASVVDLQHLLDPDMVEFVVDCGTDTAVNCSQCSSYRSGCNGQCVWIDDHCEESIVEQGVSPTQENQFIELQQRNKLEESDKRVNCGTHRAFSCSDCGSDRSGCKGECAWIANHCADPKQVGSHPKYLGRKKQFKKDPKEVIEFYFDVFMFIYKSNASLVDCGGHRAAKCSQCSSERRGCNGQCVWMDSRCAQRGQGNVPTYSVLIFTLDTTSKFSFSRNLPKSLEYLKSQGGIALNDHHKQGESTYPNYLALLSGALDVKGKFKGTMKDITERHKLNWAWEDWRNAGLPTLYHEDMPQFGPFHSYGREGWENRSPFMHHHRSAYHAMDSKKYDIRNGALSLGFQCMGNTPSYKRQLALLKMFARTYKDVPSFGIWNLCEYTHDTTNLVRVMDEDLLLTFKDLIEGGYTKRTLVIVMGDHGRNYGIPGKAGWLDGNSPMMMLLVPEAMKEEMPGVTDTVLKNSWKLTTFQDIHKTITDPVITRRGSEGNTGGLSLLHPIPSRTCEEASVPEVHCMCRQEKINTTDPTLIKHTHEIIREINQRVGDYSQCHPLRLQRVEWAFKEEMQRTGRVTCGGHKADSCLQCGSHKNSCNGDCKWTGDYCTHKNQVLREKDWRVYHIQLFAQKKEMENDDQSLFSFHAVFKEKVFKEQQKNRVDCGGHRADRCLDCGSHKNSCNGECKWTAGYCTYPKQVSREKELTAILRTDFYSTTSNCIQVENLQRIRPFCICRDNID